MIVKESLIYGESAYFLTRQSVSDRCVPDSLFLDFLYPVYPSPVSYVMYVPWMICPLDEKTPTDVPPSLYYILSSSAAFGRVWDMGYIGQGSSCISCNSQGTSHPGARIGRGQKIQEETIRDTSVRDGLSCQRQGIKLDGGSCNEPLMTLHFLRSRVVYLLFCKREKHMQGGS